MARKKLRITHELPYHITARSNNRESFYLPPNDCWRIFCDRLQSASLRFHFQIHAFVLMANHYHLLGTTSEEFPLPKVMEWLQRSVNRKINDWAGRINHVFGGPYRASLITSEMYYAQALKYIYRNPVTAGVTAKVEHYRFSSLNDPSIPLATPITGIAAGVPKRWVKLLDFLNEGYIEGEKELIDKCIRKSTFEFPRRLPNNLVLRYWSPEVSAYH
jgi:putative transposase